MKTKTIKQCVIVLSVGLISNLGFSQNSCSFFNEQYSSGSGWTTVHPATQCHGPTVTIDEGIFSYNSCRGGEENRMFKYISPLTNSWIADFDFFLNANGTYAPAEILAAFTTGAIGQALDPYNVVSIPCNGGTFLPSDQDAIIASITSLPNSTNWGFVAGSKDGTSAWSMSTLIPCPQTSGNYYVRLQRLDATHGVISVFTNAARTIQLSGSPQCFDITGNVTNINTLQHGNIPQGSVVRKLNGSIDKMCISLQSPIISGPNQAGCGTASGCYPIYYTYSVTGAIGATYTASSWILPAGSTNISYSSDFSSVTFTFPPCFGGNVDVNCNPSFGNCTIALTKSISMIYCRVSSTETEAGIDRSFNLYPNPNSGTFTFNYEVGAGTKTNFDIIDLTGRRLSSYELKEGKNSMEVNESTLNQGIYFYSIVQDGHTILTKKFSVIK